MAYINSTFQSVGVRSASDQQRIPLAHLFGPTEEIVLNSYNGREKMRSKALLAACAALTLAAGSAQAAILIDYTFDNTANDTGAAAQVMKGGSGSVGTLATGIAGSTANSVGGFNNATLTSLTTPTAYTSFTATFEINSINSITITSLLNSGLFFGVVSGSASTGTTQFASYGRNTVANGQVGSFGYLAGSSRAGYGDHSVFFKKEGTADNGVDTLDPIASTAPTDGSLKDGFTVSMTVNNNDSWSITSTGLSTDLSDSGSIAGLWAEFSDGVGLQAHFQGDNVTNPGTFDIARMTLTAVVPEPGSLAMLGLGGLCLIKRRRRD